MSLSLTVVVLAVIAVHIVALHSNDAESVERTFLPGFLHEINVQPRFPRDPTSDFTAYREDSRGWEFDALITSTIDARFYAADNVTLMDNWGIHGIFEPHSAYIDPEKAPHSTIRPEWTAAVARRNPDRNTTLRTGIENEIVPENRSEWVDHFKSINPNGDIAFHNHEWSTHGCNTPASMMQFANSLASMRELRRICAQNAAHSIIDRKPITVLVKDVESTYGPVSIFYEVNDGFVDCRASGIIRYDYSSSIPDANILPKLTLVEQFDG